METGVESHGHDNEWVFVCEVEQVAQGVLSSGGVISPATADGNVESIKVTTIMDGVYLADMRSSCGRDCGASFDRFTRRSGGPVSGNSLSSGVILPA